MNNFGVIEIASTKTTNAPGWAYVPDRQHHHLPAPPSTTNRKRARAAAGGAPLSLADANARQEAKARREIEILDRDNARDVQIAIPPKPGGGGGGGGGISRTGGKKYTPNVRKILQSQKTFANHLDDYVALLSQQEANPATNNNNNNNNNGGGGGSSTPANANVETTGTRKSAAQRQASASAAVAASSKKPAAAKQEAEDVEMLDVPDTSSSQERQPPRSAILTPHPLPPTCPGDDDPLLASRLPAFPSDDELRALLAAPPLSYLEARGTWPPDTGGDGQQYPTRAFCVVCGYWGRVRCMKCGTRVCALECLETHQEECVTRYGL
ncbi:hypothetical protein FHL15_008877 [Xylaria flabelliformis]|uniref:HIT-type domain-containing protein n=1 Tax=Xylaria flabelliformis TaxID=2512241 RepID=A0A553HQD7_9PEZI|nr:hypothetical protein FHL15_008877 [Xylaria flabelliformis]